MDDEYYKMPEFPVKEANGELKDILGPNHEKIMKDIDANIIYGSDKAED